MLTQEQQMIRDMARDFARERLAPAATATASRRSTCWRRWAGSA